MVKRFGKGGKTSIEADVIVLGCTLPGMVAAHKLLKKFGDTMDIVLLDLHSGAPRTRSRGNVAFMDVAHDDSDSETLIQNRRDRDDYTARQILDNLARLYLQQYAKDLRVPLPDPIIYPEGVEETYTIYQDSDESDDSQNQGQSKQDQNENQDQNDNQDQNENQEQEELDERISLIPSLEKIPLQKLFQYPNGSKVEFISNVHDFEYLNLFEKFELNQYQTYLDRSMADLFQTSNADIEQERKLLLYYDQTTMEQNICDTLLFSTSREIMRLIVRLVCGSPANNVSLLFYLHQCYRTSSTRNHLGGINTKFREKLLGHCRKRLTSKLHKSVAEITLTEKSIKGIRQYSQKVILETIKGETTYICNLLAMALKPEELHNIEVEDKLMSEETEQITKEIKHGQAKKFTVQYEENFWSRQGYSGDIFSMRGPIIWAMQKPKLSSTGSSSKYSTLVGYLKVREDGDDCKEAVLEQLVNMFGEAAATPVSYRESNIKDIYVPRCGDYVALRKLTTEGSPKFLEWGALDIFGDGDVASALEAGHTAYLSLMGCLRPQAQTFDDVIACDWPTFLREVPTERWKSQINVYSGIKLTVFATALCIGIYFIRSYMTKVS
ncbi:hypothetical protein PYW08_006660 [Mythimna loreyi]|uniref:Uncharacterized protein n=1 Tax=Mythimna loreyi TaxID=667449 RepID=A0ACC2R7H5_9NEOP|nr:hypothetical protein PYW08_006660 [Mythimna loreyi]